MRKLLLLSLVIMVVSCAHNSTNNNYNDSEVDSIVVDQSNIKRDCIGGIYLGMPKSEFDKIIATESQFNWYDNSYTVDENGTTFFNDSLVAVTFISNVQETIPSSEKKNYGRLDKVTNQYHFICDMIKRNYPQADISDSDMTPADLLRTFNNGDWYLQVSMTSQNADNDNLDFIYKLSYYFQSRLERMWANNE